MVKVTTNLADESQLSPEDQRKLKKRLQGGEQSPSARHFTRSYEFFQRQLDGLGSPYDVTHIPISVLKQMQRDPMISFGLHFIYSPVYRSRWYIECEDAQIAAFIDKALRRILARYIQQRSQAFSYGFAPIIKRFQLEQPNWTYVDPVKGPDPIPVWSEGNVKAITWKPFTILPSDPSQVQPSFKESDGSFNGIDYQGGANLIPFNQINNEEDGKKHVDLAHSLWITNEKDSANGSLWGYPRIGYVYRIWYSKWFRWALADRFFERKADPPFLVYFPTDGGAFSEDDEGDIDSNRARAIALGDAARSSGTLALPGDHIVGYDDRPVAMRKWEISELEVHGDMTHFQESFDYLDVMMLRGLWIPEQALIEGQGGTSSRNVATSEIAFHKEASGALADEIDDEINRWIIPDLIATNFPEFKGECKKITTGFTEADQQTMQQALQWVIQAGDETAQQNMDVRQLLDRVGLPLKSQQEISKEMKEAEKALQESTPPVVNPEAGNAAVNQQGFYVQGRPSIQLSELEDFVHNLPKSKHFEDKVVLSFAKALRARWRNAYKDVYDSFLEDFAKQELTDEAYIETLNLDASLVPNKPNKTNWVEKSGGLPKPIADMAGDLISEAGMSTSHAIATAVNQARKLCAKGNGKYCSAIASWEKKKASAHMSLAEDDFIERFLKEWEYERQKLSSLIDDSETILKDVMERAGTRELREADLSIDFTTTEDIEQYLAERGAQFVKTVDETTKEEIRNFLSNEVALGHTQEEIIRNVRDHFADFPDWKADRLVRSEVRNAYNMATLFAGEKAGIKVVRAKDAQKGETDEVCMERDGKFFKIANALRETLTEHPNGTLEWNYTKLDEPPEVVKASEMPDSSDSLGYYDSDNNIIYLSDTISKESEQEYMKIVGDRLEHE